MTNNSLEIGVGMLAVGEGALGVIMVWLEGISVDQEAPLF